MKKNKYFYPIFKLKIKSWIKYWLIKKTEFKGKLSEILEGFSFTLNNTLSMKFNLFEIYGNSIQDGEPSPDNEVPILNAGDNGSITEKIVSKNFLEITEDNVLIHCSYVSGANTNEYKLLCTTADMYVNDVQSTGTSYNKARNGNLIPCEYGETIYFDIGNSLFNKNYFNEFDENLISLGNYNRQMSNGTYTPTNANCKYITFRFGYGVNAVAGTTYTLAPIVSKTPIDSYVPHEEQIYTIPVQAPFRNIGDIRDCFVKKSDGWYERHMPYIASYNGETLPQDVYNEVEGIKYCNEKSMSTTGQFSIGASVQYVDENNWNDLPCTEEQTQQLENRPSTFAGQTTVFSIDKVKPYLRVQYYKEE